MAEYSNPCSDQDATFCMNGGTCYKLASTDTLTCICHDNFRGSRCEQFQLPAHAPNPEDRGLIAAVVIVCLLILVVLVVVIYKAYTAVKERNRLKPANVERQLRGNFDI